MHDREAAVLGRADGAELEAVATEREWGGAVAVLVIDGRLLSSQAALTARRPSELPCGLASSNGHVPSPLFTGMLSKGLSSTLDSIGMASRTTRCQAQLADQGNPLLLRINES